MKLEVLEPRSLLAADFGDSTLTFNLPSHEIDSTQTTLFLGTGVDSEPQPNPNFAANGDDQFTSGFDDEDGLVDAAQDLQLTAGATPVVRVRATNLTGRRATLSGWIDLDRDAAFEDSERVDVRVTGAVRNRQYSLTFPAVPLDVEPGTTYLRLRLSSDDRALSPSGLASDGEAEDHVGSINLQSSGSVDRVKEIALGSGENGSPVANQPFSGYGKAVGAIGDLDQNGTIELVVGAPGMSANSEQGSGQLFVQFTNFDGSVSGMTIGDELGGGPALAEHDAFGRSIAVLGDTDGDGVSDIAVGAEGDNGARGAVYILRLNANGTVKSHTKIASGANGGPSLAVNTFFGQSLAAMGDLNGDGITDLAVGASGGDVGTETNSLRGSMYVLLMNRDGSVKSNVRIARGVNGGPALRLNDNFGISMTSLGDIDNDGVTDLAVGAPGGRETGINPGGVYVLKLNGNGTVKSSTRIPMGVVRDPFLFNDGLFGAAVSSMGDLDGDGVPEIAVGAPHGSNGILGPTGALHLVRLNADGTAKSAFNLGVQSKDWLELQGGEHFGAGVTALGDIDGDGGVELAVAASNETVDNTSIKPLRLLSLNGKNYFRQLNGPSPHPLSVTSLSGANGAQVSPFASASNAGDVNGDGFEDFVVATTSYGLPYAAVVFGTERGFDSRIDLQTLDGRNGFRVSFGGVVGASAGSVSGGGDINGDGFADLVIGRPDISSQTGDFYAGTTFVLFGKSSPFAPVVSSRDFDGQQGFRLKGFGRYDYSGASISSAGDVNGDGFDDVVIGASGHATDSRLGAGAAYVVFGKSSGFAVSRSLFFLDGSNGFRIDGAEAGDNLGTQVSSAGDLNGDGFDDILVSAPRADLNGNPEAGAGYVLFGKANGFPAAINVSTLDGTNGFRLEGPSLNRHTGASASMIGDINGDGVDDLVIGSNIYDETTTTYSGESYVVLGKKTPFAASVALSSLNGSDGFRIDGSVGSEAGDVNGDGIDDWLIGSSTVAADSPVPSAAYVIFGHANGFFASMSLADINGFTGLRIESPSSNISADSSAVSTAGDVNGDGFDDILLNGGGVPQGPSVIVFGGDFNLDYLSAVGGFGRDSLGIINEIAIGAQGADNLFLPQRSQVRIGGQGDDTIFVFLEATEFRRIDGGTGYDRVVFFGGQTLDLTTLPDRSLFDVEELDFTDPSIDSLTLNFREVLNISGTSNTLRVRRGSTDTLIIDGVNAAQRTTQVQGLVMIDTYTFGAATLIVETLDQTPPTAAFVAVSPNPRTTSVGLVTLNFSEVVNGVDLSDFSLTRDGIAVSLAGVTVSGSGANYSIDLSTVTAANGAYVLKLLAGRAGIQDASGNLLATQIRTSWSRVPATSSLSALTAQVFESAPALMDLI